MLEGDAGLGGAPPNTPALPLLLGRAKWLILVVFCAVSAVALSSIWLLIQPSYRATAVVHVAPVIPRLVFDTEERVAAGGFYRIYMNTQISKITGHTVLKRVLDREDVKRTRWFQENPRTLQTMLGAPPPSRLERLGDALSAKELPSTELIQVQMVTTVAADAAVMVNAVVSEYLRQSQEATSELDQQLFTELRRQHKELQRQLQVYVEATADLSKKLGTDDPDLVRAELVQRRSKLEVERSNLYRSYRLTQQALALRSSGENDEQDDSASAVTENARLRYRGDAEWLRRQNALVTAQQKLQTAGERYGYFHPQIRELQDQIHTAEGLLRQRESELAEGWQSAAVPIQKSANSSVFQLDATTLRLLGEEQKLKLDLFDEQIEAIRVLQEEKGELAKQLAQIAERRQRKSELYGAIHARLQTLETEQKAPGRISVASTAVVPSRPDRDRRFSRSVMALGGAMMLGLAVAYLRETINPRINEARDVPYTIRVPFLGQLPRCSSDGTSSTDVSSACSEGMRMIRTALLERLRGTHDRVVLITSASGQAGKTAVAIDLAKSLAQLGKKTLLVEADLRRPSHAERLGLESGAGLAALLSGTKRRSQVTVRNVIAKLDVVPAGERLANFDSELLANGRFAACLAQWKKSYDYILLDSPPVLPVADSQILAGQADGTLMVLRSSHCRRSDAIRGYAALSAAGATLLGTILVGGRPHSGYAYESLYRAGHEGSPALPKDASGTGGDS